MWRILIHTIVYCIAAVSLLEIAIIDIGGLLSKFIISLNAKKPLPQLVGKGDKAPFLRNGYYLTVMGQPYSMCLREPSFQPFLS